MKYVFLELNEWTTLPLSSCLLCQLCPTSAMHHHARSLCSLLLRMNLMTLMFSVMKSTAMNACPGKGLAYKDKSIKKKKTGWDWRTKPLSVSNPVSCSRVKSSSSDLCPGMAADASFLTLNRSKSIEITLMPSSPVTQPCSRPIYKNKGGRSRGEEAISYCNLFIDPVVSKKKWISFLMKWLY